MDNTTIAIVLLSGIVAVIGAELGSTRDDVKALRRRIEELERRLEHKR